MKKLAIKKFWLFKTPTPEKFVARYSESEKAEIKRVFEKITKNYKSRSIILLVITFGSLVFAMLCLLRPASPLWLIWLAWSILLIGVILQYFWHGLYCPGCRIVMDQGFGSFCPECGGKLLFEFLKGTKCCDCGNKLRRGRGRSYKIKYCSFCGVQVDEKGF